MYSLGSRAKETDCAGRGASLDALDTLCYSSRRDRDTLEYTQDRPDEKRQTP